MFHNMSYANQGGKERFGVDAACPWFFRAALDSSGRMRCSTGTSAARISAATLDKRAVRIEASIDVLAARGRFGHAAGVAQSS